MPLACGLEIGPTSVKAAILDGNARSARVVDFAVVKVDAKKKESLETAVAEALGQVLSGRKVPVQNVVASVRAQDAVVREMTVPFVRDDQIRKTIKFQAETFFHGTSIDDVVVEYLKFGEGEGRSKLLVAGVKKAVVERQLRLLEEHGIDPIAVDLDLAALVSCYAHAGVFEGNGLVLCLEIEQDTLKIALVEDGKLRLARAIRIRTGTLAAPAKSREASVPTDEGAIPTAERPSAGSEATERGNAKRVVGGAERRPDDATDEGAVPKTVEPTESSGRLPVVILVDEDEAAFSLEDSAVSPEQREDYLSRVFLEIDRTLAAATLRRKIDLVCLSGASCALEGIEKIFQERFETAVEKKDLAGRFGAGADRRGKGEPSLSLQGATAIGLALKALGHDPFGLDFRQEELRFRGKYETLKKGAACALCLVFALTFLFAFGLKQRLKERRRTLEGVRHVEEMLYGVLFPDLSPADKAGGDHKPEPVAGRWFESLSFERQRLEGIYGAGGGGLAGGNTSALVILREFALAKQRMGKDWSIEVTQMHIDPREGGLSKFTFDSPTDAAGIQLQKAFESSTLCEGTTQSSRVEKGKCRTDFVVKLKKQAEGS